LTLTSSIDRKHKAVSTTQIAGEISATIGVAGVKNFDLEMHIVGFARSRVEGVGPKGKTTLLDCIVRDRFRATDAYG